MEFLEHGKEKHIVKVENLSNVEQMIRNGGIQKNLKSKPLSSIPIRDLDERWQQNKGSVYIGTSRRGRNETRNPRVGKRVWWKESSTLNRSKKLWNIRECLIFRLKWVRKSSLRKNGIQPSS
ncbi:hypothetical protein AVEN_226151-1 [Araneus ventricosus]|uniref:Uncharacterized protein n=1 Tax=Araneus ventricosus TaxID=182803 RepID=A0A4Y2TQ39_ARAVE|nr:hypothetical protein AVEN_226151-1 [Araneus ventricosus]